MNRHRSYSKDQSSAATGSVPQSQSRSITHRVNPASAKSVPQSQSRSNIHRVKPASAKSVPESQRRSCTHRNDPTTADSVQQPQGTLWFYVALTLGVVVLAVIAIFAASYYMIFVPQVNLVQSMKDDTLQLTKKLDDLITSQPKDPYLKMGDLPPMAMDRLPWDAGTPSWFYPCLCIVVLFAAMALAAYGYHRQTVIMMTNQNKTTSQLHNMEKDIMDLEHKITTDRHENAVKLMTILNETNSKIHNMEKDRMEQDYKVKCLEMKQEHQIQQAICGTRRNTIGDGIGMVFDGVTDIVGGVTNVFTKLFKKK